MTLFGGHGNITVDFKSAQWKGVINRQSGLFNPPETWGAWSIGDRIRLEFAKPLPRKFNLTLNARAFGSNQKANFILRIGSQTITFQVNAYPEFEQITIPVENLSRTNVLEIDIPKPTSPKEMGLGEDSRKLGIGLTQLQVQW
jgi:phosphoglycerol transferase